MKKNPEPEEEHELEILKAVAQAWHGRSTNSRPTNEFDAHKLNFKAKPTRFNLEAMSNNSSTKNKGTAIWDFGQSLWDSYEIVTVSKKLEIGLVMDHQFLGEPSRFGKTKKRKESKNSLRSLLDRSSSGRFKDPDVSRYKDS